MGRISIVSTAAEGVLVTALGTDAMSIAGTGAVLLAARLAVPVAAASLSDPSSVRDAAGRLFDAGVTSLALSPCVIGPETDHLDLGAVAEAAGMKTALPLGAQPPSASSPPCATVPRCRIPSWPAPPAEQTPARV